MKISLRWKFLLAVAIPLLIIYTAVLFNNYRKFKSPRLACVLMKLSCTHCGDVFTITAEQLGTRGKCPHCKATIILPRAAGSGVLDGELKPPSLWMERWFSMLGAVFLHVLVIAILALIPYRFLSEGELAGWE